MVVQESILPITFSNKKRVADDTRILAADVGGTKTNIALFVLQNGALSLKEERTYESGMWRSFKEMVQHFIQSTQAPDRLCIAVAGPVRNGNVKMTNLNWEIDSEELQNALEVEEVSLINDLEAKAYGLATLPEQDLLLVYPGKEKMEGNAAIIAPGTGLGEAGLYWDGATFHPFPSEGGHTDFSPRTQQDINLLLHLQKRYGHVSWERLVSGPGIYNIYQFLREVEKCEEPASLKKMLEELDPAQVISENTEDYAICRETMELFLKYLAVEASNLALKLKAVGGIFIGGGIMPKIWNEARQEVFLDHFFQVGRMRPLIEAIPVHIILNTRTAVLGAAYYGSYQ